MNVKEILWEKTIKKVLQSYYLCDIFYLTLTFSARSGKIPLLHFAKAGYAILGNSNIIDNIKAELEPFLRENNYCLFDINYVKEDGEWYLRIYIDYLEKEENLFIGIDDCVKVSKYISKRLDETDPIERNYFLEVSSPGIDAVKN